MVLMTPAHWHYRGLTGDMAAFLLETSASGRRAGRTPYRQKHLSIGLPVSLSHVRLTDWNRARGEMEPLQFPPW